MFVPLGKIIILSDFALPHCHISEYNAVIYEQALENDEQTTGGGEEAGGGFDESADSFGLPDTLAVLAQWQAVTEDV